MNSHLPDRFFVTGIGTDVGKTVVSAVLVNALKADYWKPVQSGSNTDSDSRFVKTVSQFDVVCHQESYLLREPFSPHYAAELDGVEINPESIVMPQTKNRLVVEGAGGVMVPLTKDFLIAHLIQKLQLPVVLVMRNYLGSINHTLLSVEYLKRMQIEILGVVISGAAFPSSENVIFHKSGLPLLGRVDEADVVDKNFIQQQAANWIVPC
jgi:dethiobiotin synthetase